MINFEVIHIKEFETKQKVNKLIRNGKCFVDEFWDEIKRDKNIGPELDELIATLEDVANCKMLPKNQYRKISLSRKLKYSTYEVKSKHLRLYLFHESKTGQILLLGGKKVEQEKDIKKVEKIVKEYTAFINSI